MKEVKITFEKTSRYYSLGQPAKIGVTLRFVNFSWEEFYAWLESHSARLAKIPHDVSYSEKVIICWKE